MTCVPSLYPSRLPDSLQIRIRYCQSSSLVISLSVLPFLSSLFRFEVTVCAALLLHVMLVSGIEFDQYTL